MGCRRFHGDQAGCQQREHGVDSAAFSLAAGVGPGSAEPDAAVGPAVAPGSDRATHPENQRRGGEQRRQPVFSIVFQASMALCRSILRRLCGTGGCGGVQR